MGGGWQRGKAKLWHARSEHVNARSVWNTRLNTDSINQRHDYRGRGHTSPAHHHWQILLVTPFSNLKQQPLALVSIISHIVFHHSIAVVLISSSRTKCNPSGPLGAGSCWLALRLVTSLGSPENLCILWHSMSTLITLGGCSQAIENILRSPRGGADMLYRACTQGLEGVLTNA